MELIVNETARQVTSSGDTPLLWVIREELRLTGTKYGCGHGVCGSCIVDIDGTQAHACQCLLKDVAGRRITTIEGQTGPVADAVLSSWTELDVAQCGFCQPGQINSAITLLKQIPNPSDDDIDEAMKHNLCRCATYVRVRKAIHQAAAKLAAR